MSESRSIRTESARPEVKYRLVVFDAPDDPKDMRDLIVRVTGLHAADAMRWASKAPGVFPSLIAEPLVRPLLDGMYELGIAAEAWREDGFPDLSRPRTVHDLACLPEGLRITGLRGEPTHWVPWGAIELVSAGRILVEDDFGPAEPPRWSSTLAMGMQMLVRRPARWLRTRRASRIPRDPIGELHLVRKDPRIVFRVVSTQMNYASLGERLRPASAENFPILLSAIVAQANDARLTPATRSLLEAAARPTEDTGLLTPTAHDFADSHELLAYTTLQLLWGWYRRDRDAHAPA